ncbi:uncharacterized protein LOC125777639 [Bactrocera dorsalis]|uniref:Uncharacterized protein LOC125777639 n=1 Tax=Bactrocera dorsalis TaxID=27457 RepID=A0ABM3JHI9_BACDO|nr:uncharacterized protein LOC125777639 [Bactrocera dorsalis]
MTNIKQSPSEDNSEDRKPLQPTSNVIRPIQFNPDKPSLWIAQIEAQFRILGVVRDVDKFYHAVSILDTRHAAEVEDIIVDPPTSAPFTALKMALISRFSKSKEAKLQQLLEGEEIGDRTPSQLLRHLKALVPGVDEDVLKAKWLSALPKDTRAMLALQTNTTLENLGASADRLHEIIQGMHVSSVSKNTNNTNDADFAQQISDLTKQLAALSAVINKRESRSNTRQHNKPRPRNQFQQRRLSSNGFCYYHSKYGKNAIRCKPGCTFSGNAVENL